MIKLDPYAWYSGSAGYAGDLVYTSLQEVAHVTPDGDNGVIITPTSTRYDAAFLCQRLRARGVVTSKADTERCMVAFDTASNRDRMLIHAVVDVGLFRVTSETPEHSAADDGRQRDAPMRLSSMTLQVSDASATEIGEIDIITMPMHEQWRRLFAREIDVVPNLTAFYYKRFQDMRSVRIIDIPTTTTVSMYFNTRRAPWSDRDLRRAIAHAIDRDALSDIACRRDGCAARDWATAPPGSPPSIPRNIRLLVLSSDTTVTKAADALSYHLRANFRTDVIIERSDLLAINDRLERGDYELFLGPLPRLDTAQQRVGFGHRLQMIAHYRSPDLTAALAADDRAEIARIIREDAPVLPLFHHSQFAAVDNRYCGGKPETDHSWRWLAQLRPCAGQERP